MREARDVIKEALKSIQGDVKPCPRCDGIGYHHGFGEAGHDPDWCENCGGSTFVEKYSEDEAPDAILTALSSAGIDCEGWRDIESAPANQLVLLFCPERGVANLERIELGYASHGSPRTAMSYHAWATHWRPLPLPPLASGGG